MQGNDGKYIQHMGDDYSIAVMVKHTIGKTYCRRCIIRSSWWVEVGASSLDIRRAGEDERCRNLLPCSHRE